ncbi:MAG: HNH endonuclease [Terriglobales bacterium]
MADNARWSRDELIAAFNLYCRIPFGRIHTGNPEVIALADVLGRSPSAVAWKLANYARLDPTLKARKIAGASHGSKQEEAIWREFHSDWESLAFESELALARLKGMELATEVDDFPEGRTKDSVVRVRLNQKFFRAAVLAAYNFQCCITGLSVTQLLSASHIVPWAVDVKNRANPRNGLCLNAIHDRAFDCGLITITDYRVVVSPVLKKKAAEHAVSELILRYENATIMEPERFAPSAEFLRYHFEHIFVRS